MGNPSYEEALNRQGRVIVSLQNEIDNKNLKLKEMEHKHRETLACMRILIIGLTENINSKERCLLEMECKYNESLNMVQKLTNERDKLRDGCQKGITLKHTVWWGKFFLFVVDLFSWKTCLNLKFTSIYLKISRRIL